MCKVCTEAVHCIAFWKRTLSQVKTSPQKHTKNTPKTQPHHHKKHHHKNTTTKTPQKHNHSTTKKHHHKNTITKNITTKKHHKKHHHKKHHHKNTATPTQKHHHKNTTKTPPQEHHKNTTTRTPQKHHHKNTTTKTPPQEHHHKNTTTKNITTKNTTTKNTTTKNTTTKTPTEKTPPQKKNTTTRTPPQKHNHKNITTKTPPLKHHHTTAKTPPQYYSSTTLYYKVLQSTAPVVLKVLLCSAKYYSVLQSTIPVLLCTTLYYSVLQSITPVLPRTRSTTPVLLCYYKVLLQYYSSTEKASKMIVSCGVSEFHRKSFQNERFVRSFRQFSQKKVPKWSFRARLPPNFTEKTSKTSVSCEASDNFHRRRFQNDRFVRGFIQISQRKVPKRAFRARLLQNFTEKTSKTSVSCEASDNFHRRRFQNDRFVRGCFKISQKKLPKRAFRAKLPTIFTEEGSKMIVSCEASGNFHGKNIQKDRFARCFRQFSQKKHPKGSFRAMLPTIFTEKTSKRTESLKWKKIPQKNGKKFPEKFWTRFFLGWKKTPMHRGLFEMSWWGSLEVKYCFFRKLATFPFRDVLLYQKTL